MRLVKSLILLFFGSTCFNHAFADSSVTDSLSRVGNNDDWATPTRYNFKPTQLIAPSVLLAAGIAGVYTFDSFRDNIRHTFSGKRHGHQTTADDYLQYVNAPAYLALGFIPGLKHRYDFTGRILGGVTAYAIMAAMTNIMKVAFKEKRPDTNETNSFPSGHSATAFTGAELIRLEYGNLVGLAGYAMAATVGYLRIHNDRHWINDILGGAAIGILSARIAYWLLPWERSLFKLDNKTKIYPSSTNNIDKYPYPRPEHKKSPGADLVILPLVGQTNGLSLTLTY